MAKKTPSKDVTHEISSRLDAICGVIDLARAAVFSNTDDNSELTAAWLALDLASENLTRLSVELSGADQVGAPRLMLVPQREGAAS